MTDCGNMKLRIGVLLIALTCCMQAGALVIYVNGNKITGSTTINTGGGTVKYVSGSKVLSITDVTFERSGSDNNGIDNQDVDGLIINFFGNNSMTINNADVLNLKAKTTINIKDGTTTLKCTAGGQNAIKARGADVTVLGNGKLVLKSTDGPAIEGSKGTETVEMKIAQCDITGARGDFYNLYGLKILPVTEGGAYSTKITLNPTGGSSYAHVRSVNMSHWEIGENMKIVTPEWGAFSELTDDSFYFKKYVIADIPSSYINYGEFPDYEFRAYISRNFDGNNDGYLSPEEIAKATTLSMNSLKIRDLTGIKYFTAATLIKCNDNLLSSIDVSGLKSLVQLQCSGNQLTSLNVSGTTSLESIYCHKNQLGSAAMAALVNGLPNYSTPTGQLYVAMDDNDQNIITTTQVERARAKGWTVYYRSGEAHKGMLEINATNFPDANFRNTIAGSAYDTNRDGYFSPTELGEFTILDLTNKGISDLTGINYLTALNTLLCGQNNLRTLDVSALTSLKVLNCYNNSLTSLQVSGLSQLTKLDCSDNQLSTLDCTGTSLIYLYIYCNSITGDKMTRLINTLPTYSILKGSLYALFQDNDNEGNMLSRTQVHLARDNKGWRVFYYNGSIWGNYAGDGEVGDVNGDGIVSGADVTALYGYLLDSKEAGGDADVSGDGVVSGADVTALYNILLK